MISDADACHRRKFKCKDGGLQGCCIRNKNGRSQHISEWLVAMGLRAENWRVCSLQNTLIKNWWKNRVRLWMKNQQWILFYTVEEIQRLGKRFVQRPQWNNLPVWSQCKLKCLGAAVREGAAKAFMAAQTPLYNLYSHNARLEWVCSEWYRLYVLAPLHAAGASTAWSVRLHIMALFSPVAFLRQTSQKLSRTLWRDSLVTRISCLVWIPINCSSLNVAKWAF